MPQKAKYKPVERLKAQTYTLPYKPQKTLTGAHRRDIEDMTFNETLKELPKFEPKIDITKELVFLQCR